MSKYQIYALRDRLIDYYLRPFTAPDDKEVLASLATTINSGEGTSAIQNAPHHFEIWRLGSITEEGDCRPGKELIADCSSLVRGNIRERTDRGAEALRSPQVGERETTGRPPGGRDTAPSAAQNAAQTENGQGGQEPQGDRGGSQEPVRLEDTEAYRAGYAQGAADS